MCSEAIFDLVGGKWGHELRSERGQSREPYARVSVYVDHDGMCTRSSWSLFVMNNERGKVVSTLVCCGTCKQSEGQLSQK